MASMRPLRLTLVCLLLLSSATLRAGELLDRANEAYNGGEPHRAIELYRKAALGGENPALCYFNMANAYYQMDSLPQCIVYYRACIGYAPEFFRAYLNLAIAYFSLEELGSTIATARRALSLEPGDEKATMILAAAYRKAGAYPEAIATFEQLAAAYPENEEPPVALAEMFRELGDTPEAITWLQRYPADGKNKGYVNILLADLYESRGEIERALYYLREAWDIDTSNRWVFYRIIELHKKVGNTLIALEQAQRGVETMPSFAELALLGGNLAFELDRLDEAERLYTIARNSGSAGAVVGLENIRIVRMNQLAAAEGER